MPVKIIFKFAPKTIISAGAIIALLMSCAGSDVNDTTNLMPVTISNVQDRMPKNNDSGKPIIALVLGGGGLRGYAHVGVLKSLHEAGIKFDMVVGTSVGSVIGAAYASGLSPQKIEDLAQEVDLTSLIDFTFSKSGIMRGIAIEDWLNSITDGVPMEQFPIQFAAIATDLHSENAVMLSTGLAGSAVRASSAVPGVTVPVPYNDGYLIDGGVTSLIPVRFARALGADVVIAVNIYCHGPATTGMGMLSVIQKVMHSQSCAIADSEMKEADVLISPEVQISGISASHEQVQAIVAGYESAQKMLPLVTTKILALSNNAGK